MGRDFPALSGTRQNPRTSIRKRNGGGATTCDCWRARGGPRRGAGATARQVRPLAPDLPRTMTSIAQIAWYDAGIMKIVRLTAN